MGYKVFIDSDILLDLFLSRNPFSVYTQEILRLAEGGELTASTSSIIVNNLYYFIKKYTDKDSAKKAIKQLMKFCSVLPVDETIVSAALDSNFGDFEDALQYHTALKFNCEKLLTRNLKHYKQATIPVLTAEQFLKAL
jgi:predicted nucleic acid-binding protein